MFDETLHHNQLDEMNIIAEDIIFMFSPTKDIIFLAK